MGFGGVEGGKREVCVKGGGVSLRGSDVCLRGGFCVTWGGLWGRGCLGGSFRWGGSGC